MKLNLRSREEEEEENKNNKKNKNNRKKKRTEEERKNTTIKKSNHNIGLKNDCFEYSLVCKEVDFWCPAEEEYSNLVLTPSQAPGFFIRNFCGKAASPT